MSQQTGMGIPGIDPAEDVVMRRVVLSAAAGRAEYNASYLAKQEIDQPKTDLIRAGYKLEDLPEWADNAAIVAGLADIGDTDIPEDRGALNILSRLYGEGNKCGGAVGVLVVRDGLQSSEPLDLDRIEDLVTIEILERDEIQPYRTTAGGVPQHYVIGTSRTDITASSIIHRSRLILTMGRRLSPSEEWRAQGWGASVLENLYGERRAVHGADQSIGALVARTIVNVKSYAQLSEQLCDDKAAEDFERRQAQDARTMSQYRTMLLDGGKNAHGNDPGRPGDTFEPIAVPVRGVADLRDTLSKAWAGGTRQTPSIALGETAGPFSSGKNEGDWESWGGYISGEQETWLEPRLDRVLVVLCASKEGPTRGRVPETRTYNFNPLTTPTAQEDAETRATEAANDAALLLIDPSLGPAIIDQRVYQGATGALRLDPPEPPPVNAEGEEVDPETGETLEQPEPEDVPGETVEDVEPTDDELAWSDATPPDGAATATDLAAVLDVTPQLIHSVARKYDVTAYHKPGYAKIPLYVKADVLAALLMNDDGIAPGDVPEPADN